MLEAHVIGSNMLAHPLSREIGKFRGFAVSQTPVPVLPLASCVTLVRDLVSLEAPCPPV